MVRPRPSLSLLLLAAAAAVLLPRCELPEEEPTADAAAADVADAGATADAAADAVTTPVPCAALAGRWQVTLCGAPAAAVSFVTTGCGALLSSNDPTFDGGSAGLADGISLALDLPGGVHGPLQCEAAMAPTSFSGVCATAGGGSCRVAGVKSW